MRALALLVLMFSGCADVGNAPLGAACATSDDCANSFCVAGESDAAPFCSRDCRGRTTGEACGEDDQGRCVADLHEWCWLPCDADADCAKVNAERGTCGAIVGADFKVCLASP